MCLAACCRALGQPAATNTTNGAADMCFEDDTSPFVLPLTETTTQSGLTLRTETLLLGKVTTLRRGGEHISFKGLRYPLLQPVHDTKAIIGHHTFALHFAPTPACAIGLPDEYGSHRLAVLPSRVWDLYTNEIRKPRCWHSDGCIPLFCMDCWNLTPAALQNPDFWQCFKTYCAKNGDVLRTLSRDQIWQRQLVVTEP
jgi:hypothetical protein